MKHFEIPLVIRRDYIETNLKMHTHKSYTKLQELYANR